MHEKKTSIYCVVKSNNPHLQFVHLLMFKKRRIKNTRHGRDWLIFYLKDLARQNEGSRIVAAYEPLTLGFGIYDGLVEAGIECHVLAPTKMPKAAKDRKKKTDERDARWILEMLLAHVLAVNELPDIRIPDHQTRDDEETVRARLDVGKKLTSLKNKVQTLLKRNGVVKPEVEALSETDRYEEASEYLVVRIKGVVLLTAMVFLTEGKHEPVQQSQRGWILLGSGSLE